jgi:hypothetical protein
LSAGNSEREVNAFLPRLAAGVPFKVGERRLEGLVDGDLEAGRPFSRIGVFIRGRRHDHDLRDSLPVDWRGRNEKQHNDRTGCRAPEHGLDGRCDCSVLHAGITLPCGHAPTSVARTALQTKYLQYAIQQLNAQKNLPEFASFSTPIAADRVWNPTTGPGLSFLSAIFLSARCVRGSTTAIHCIEHVVPTIRGTWSFGLS